MKHTKNIGPQLDKIVGQPKTMKHPTANSTWRSEYRLPCKRPGCITDDHNVETAENNHSHSHLSSPGSGKLERKANGDLVYHAPWQTAYAKTLTRRTRTFKSPELKARVDKTSAAAIERIAADITTDDVRATGQNGRAACAGYEVRATDGHRALLIPGPGRSSKDEQPLAWLGSLERPKRTFSEFEQDKESACYGLAAVIDDKEFHLALQRAMVMLDGRKDRNHTVELFGRRPTGTLTVHSANSDIGTFDGDVQVTLTESLWFAADLYYLEVVCGQWPLHVWFKDDESAIVFEPADKSWRYVLMPIRGKATDEQLQAIEQDNRVETVEQPAESTADVQAQVQVQVQAAAAACEQTIPMRNGPENSTPISCGPENSNSEQPITAESKAETDFDSREILPLVGLSHENRYEYRESPDNYVYQYDCLRREALGYFCAIDVWYRSFVNAKPNGVSCWIEPVNSERANSKQPTMVHA